MTVVLTLARHFAIVMASDAAVREEYGSGDVSYVTGAKSFELPGIGVVTTWGARDGNNIGHFVTSLKGSKVVLTVDDLAQGVHRYLIDTVDPKGRRLSGVGYHIAGFWDGVPYAYHVFWQPALDGVRAEGSYEFQIHSPPTRKATVALYNGRHDLAHQVVTSVFEEVRKGYALRTSLSTATGLVSFAHLVLRFASEISLDVGPPFLVRVIAPDNTVRTHPLSPTVPFGDAEFTATRDFANAIETLRHGDLTDDG